MRIAHFTDVHFTAPPGGLPPRGLFSKRILGWLNVRWFGRYEDFAGVPDVLEAFLRDLDETAPDHILSTGDLTAISLPEEFEAVRAALRGLLERPDVTGIPGNHDVYVRSAVAARLYENAFGAWTRTDLSREDVPERFRELYPYPLVRRLGDSTALIALRDVRPNPLHDSSGRVGELQLEALRHALRDPGLAARRKVLAVHCGVLRRDGSPDRRFHRLRDGARLLQLAAEGGVDLVVHGHIHRRAVVPRGPRAPVPLANPGSLTAARGERAYHVYHFGPEAIRVEVRAFDAGRGRFSSRPELETSLPLAPR